MEAVFGNPAELETQEVEVLADEALGYSSTTDSESADDGNEDEAPSDTQSPVAETDQVHEQPAMDAATWHAKEAQYEQALQYMARVTQAMQAQMQQAGLLPIQPGAQPFSMGFPYQSPQNTPQAPYSGQAGLPPTVQQTFGYPAGQTPAFGQPAYAVHGTQSAAAPASPAAPQNEVSDEELKEQYWEDPVKATRTLLEQQAARHRAEMEQREAYFGQVLGQQFLGPLMQQVQAQTAEQQFRDRVSQDYSALKEQHDDFDAVAPVMRQMIKEQPQLIAQMRIDPQKHGLAALYALAKTKAGAGTAQPSLQSVPGGGKGAARMPRAGAARMQQTADNDALVDAALGPIASGGVFG